MALIFLVCLFTAGLGPILYSTKVLRDDPVKHGSSKASIGDASLCPSEEVTSHLSSFLASESPFYQSAGTDPTEERTVTIEHFLQPSDLKGTDGTVSNLNAITSSSQKATPAIFHSGVKMAYPVETTGPAANAEAPYKHSLASFSLDSLNDEEIRSVAQISVAGKFLKTFSSFVLFLAGVFIGIFCSYCNMLLPRVCIWRYGGPCEGHGTEERTLDTGFDRFEELEGPLPNSPALSAPSLVDNCSDHFLHDAADISLSYYGHEAMRGMYADDDGIRCQDTEACSSLTLSISSGNGDLKLDLAGLSGAGCAGSIGKTEQGSDAGHVDEGQVSAVLLDNDTYSDKLDREYAPSDSGHERFDTRSDGETSSLKERYIHDGNTVNETTSLSSIGSVIGNFDGSVNSVLDVDERATEDHTTYDTPENIMNSLYIPPHKRPTAPLPFRTIGVDSSSSCLEPKSPSKTRQSQYDFYKTFLEGFRPGQGPSMLINDMLQDGMTVDGDLDRRPRRSKSFLLGKRMAPRLIADRLHRVIKESRDDTAACGQLATQDVADAGEIDVGVACSSSDVGLGGFSAKGTVKPAEFELNSIPDARKRILDSEDDSQCKIPKGRKKRKSNAASPKRAPSRVLLLPEGSKSRMKVSSEDDVCAERDGADVTIRASEFRDCTFAVKGTNATGEGGDFEARELNASA